MTQLGALFFGDVEAWGEVPTIGVMTEFALVHYTSREVFYGKIWEHIPSRENPAVPQAPETRLRHDLEVAMECAEWLDRIQPERKILVSDNPAFDFMWIADLFHRTIGKNPFGHSARRIGDFYAGLVGDWQQQSVWKRLRRTKHDHNPVNDVMGNIEAFERILAGERVTRKR